MKLTEVKFNNFKNIKGGTLDIEKDITCLVGINESGKSNILLGIEKCDIEKELINEDISRHSKEYLKAGIPSIEFVLVPFENENEELKLLFGLDKIEIIKIVKTGKDYRIDYPEINYKKSSLFPESHKESKVETKKNNIELSNEITEEIRQKLIESVKQLLPRFRFFDSVDFNQYFLPEDGDVLISELLNNPEQYMPVMNLLKIADILAQDLTASGTPQERTRRDTILRKGTEKINSELLDAFWPVESVRLNLDAEGDTLKIRVQENEQFLPKERSRGLQWALAFNIFFLASSETELKNTILLIDEPGIFLHINAQRKMLETTFPSIIGRGNQIIYTTHLPYLIDRNKPQEIRILEKKNENTVIGNKAWSESEFGSIPEPVRTALGLNIEEVFLFGEDNLIVEGPADQIYLITAFQKLNPELLKKVTIVPAYGIEKIPKVLGLAILSGKKAFALIDNDKNLKNIKRMFQRVGFEDPNINNISNLCRNKEVKTIEDILPSMLFQEAVFKVYIGICNKRNRSLKVDEIPLLMPRIEKIERFFRKKLTSPKHKLLKMDIARVFEEIIETTKKKGPSSDWNICREILKNIETNLNKKRFLNGKLQKKLSIQPTLRALSSSKNKRASKSLAKARV